MGKYRVQSLPRFDPIKRRGHLHDVKSDRMVYQHTQYRLAEWDNLFSNGDKSSKLDTCIHCL